MSSYSDMIHVKKVILHAFYRYTMHVNRFFQGKKVSIGYATSVISTSFSVILVFPASVVFPEVAFLPLSSFRPKWRNLCVIFPKFHVKITVLNETSRFSMIATDYYIPNYDPLSPDANTILLLFHSTRQCELSPLPPFQRKGVIVPPSLVS